MKFREKRRFGPKTLTAACATLRPRQPTRFVTRLILESGETVGVRPGWTPGLNPGDIVTNLGKSYVLVDLRHPAPGLDAPQSEGKLILRPI